MELSSYAGYVDHTGQEVIMVVGQLPFQAGNGDFCTLLPLLMADGTKAEREDFPDNGDIFWMLRPATRHFAEPGRLVRGRLEKSPQAGTRGKADYQICADDIDVVRSKDYIELLKVPNAEANRPRDLISESITVETDHHPLDVVYLLWRGSVWGPLVTTSHEKPGTPGVHRVTFTTTRPDKRVLSFHQRALDNLPKKAHHHLTVDVSLNQTHVSITRALHTCTYQIVDAEEFEQIIPADAQHETLLSDRDVLAQVAKDVLTKKRRREFLAIFDEIEAALGDGQVANGELLGDTAEILKIIKQHVQARETATVQLAGAILQSGLLDAQIDQAKQSILERFIADNSARALAKIDASIDERKKDRESLNREIRALEEQLRVERKERFQQLERELDEERQKIRKEKASITQQRDELERQSQILEGRLEGVVKELSSNRDEIINQFLMILPLLGHFSLMPGVRRSNDADKDPVSAGSNELSRTVVDKPFVLPSFVMRERKAADGEIDELVFMARFQDHVEKSGFQFRREDLIRFHLSMKCGEVTIMGGYPGTGKSTLPRLYTEALLGDAARTEAGRFLRVAVSPSWLDMRDLLGHVNALDRVFQPGEAGLYQHLIAAQEEFRMHGLAAGLFLVCLDEMNLAHVEHYFSGLLQALELPPGQRVVKCFSPEIVSPSSTFGGWPELNIPISVRFVGTINFDETTRQLSQRLLDRANVIQLLPVMPLLSAESNESTIPAGTPVTLRDYTSWSVTGSELIEAELAEIIDKLREPLAVLGSSLNPRKLNGIRRFMASCPPEFFKPVQALDVQIAQRLLPQARNLFRPGAREALKEIVGVLEDRSADFPESLTQLNALRESEVGWASEG